MGLSYKTVAILGMLFLSAGITFAQVPTGTPPFGSFSGGPDVVDNSNLNVMIDVPVFHKAGRGEAFAYDLIYNSSIWQSATLAGYTAWYPVNNFGWLANSPTGTGFVTSQTTLTYPTCTVHGRLETGDEFQYTNYFYHDSHTTAHPYPGQTATYWTICTPGFSGFTATSPDGAGHTINVQSQVSAPVVVRSGVLLDPPAQNTFTGAGTETDTNGNEITTNSSGVTTDTLGTTALTIAGSGTPTSPITFTYTAPSGATPAYTMKFTAQTVKTNFGCSGISEFGPTSENLVSEIDLPDGTKYTFTYEATPGFSGDVTGRIYQVTLPTGGTLTYTYSGGSNGIECVDGSTAGLTRQTPDGTWTYSRTLGSGAATTTTITAPTYNSQSNQTVINFQGLYPTERQVYSGSASGGTLLKTALICYNGSTPTGTPATCNASAVTPPITQLTAYHEWPGSTVLESEVNSTYNTYGLMTEKDEYGYGSGAPGSLVRKTLTTYASLTNGIVNRPASVTVEDGSGNIKAQTTYCYDEGTPSGTTTCNAAGSPTATSGTPQQVSITGSRGNLTTTTSLVSGSTTLGKTFTYYDTGNVNVATDVNGAQTTYTYSSAGSCGNSFATSISEPLSLSRSMVWNCTGGVETSVTDENGKTASVGYNDADFWRPNSATDQLSYTTNLTYTRQTSVESSLNFNGTTSTTDVLRTVDGLGRSELAQVKESQTSSTYDSTQTEYDSLGRPAETTLPYAATAGGTCSGTCPSTSTVYDSLGRPATVTDGGGGTLSYTYTANDTYQTAGPAPSGENTKRKQLEYDALGRLTSVCEVTSLSGSGTCAQTNSVTGYWTKHTYDVTNHLTGVTQNAQSSGTQTRAYVYDDLGRITSESNPENGTTTYTYDTDSTCGTSKGDLVKKIDNAGDTICFAYDGLHRITSTTYSGTYASVTPNRYFSYDSATVNSVAMVNAKTRLAEAYTCFSPCTTKLTDEGFSYTARGQISDIYESTPNSGGYYHVTETYWANGSLNQLSGLSGLPTITYGVDGEGRVYSASASSGQNPLASTAYSVASLPTAVNLGSSDGDSFVYDPNTNRMTKYTFTVNSQSVVGNLTWNAVGTLASVAITDPFDSSNAQTCSYSHDDLIRLASDNCGSIWSQTFSYDAFGNINKTGTASFGATYSGTTNQMTLIGSSTPTYDANGNVTNDYLNTYAWDANGRPVTADSVGLTYDALGRMAEQNRSGTYTQIVYTPGGGKLGLMNGSTLQKGFVPLTGGSVAVYSSTGLAFYRHSDWIGSSRFASTPTRALYYDGAYGPFGEPYAQTGTNDFSFTGQNEDTASNLYDFPAREYGIQGRWPSPDPAGTAVVSPPDPQTWNRYAYVGNSPLSATDPSGLVARGQDAPPSEFIHCPMDYPGKCGGSSGLVEDGGDAFDYMDVNTYCNCVDLSYLNALGFLNLGMSPSQNALGVASTTEALLSPDGIAGAGSGVAWYWQPAFTAAVDNGNGQATAWSPDQGNYEPYFYVGGQDQAPWWAGQIGGQSPKPLSAVAPQYISVYLPSGSGDASAGIVGPSGQTILSGTEVNGLKSLMQVEDAIFSIGGGAALMVAGGGGLVLGCWYGGPWGCAAAIEAAPALIVGGYLLAKNGVNEVKSW